jgi:hypothetical protein
MCSSFSLGGISAGRSGIGKHRLAALAEGLDVIFVGIVGDNGAIQDKQPRDLRIAI